MKTDYSLGEGMLIYGDPPDDDLEVISLPALLRAMYCPDDPEGPPWTHVITPVEETV